jgi:hypothetical protein
MRKPQEPLTAKSREELMRLSGSDPVLKWMLDKGAPITREAYLDLAYCGDLPTPWTAEHEMEVPAPLQAMLPPR